MFIISLNFRLSTTFLFSNHVCESLTLLMFLHIFTLQMFLLSLTFVLPSTDMCLHILKNIQNILNLVHLQICEHFRFLISHSLAGRYAIHKTLKPFWEFLILSKVYILRYLVITLYQNGNSFRNLFSILHCLD
jgi:hypothetical protein